MYFILKLLYDAIHEKFNSISEQFQSIYGKCHNSVRVRIPATILYAVKCPKEKL